MDNKRLQSSVALLEKTVMTLVKEADQLRNANNELVLKMSQLRGELSDAKRGLTECDSQLSYLRQQKSSTGPFYGSSVERMQLQELQREVQELQLQLSDTKHELDRYRGAAPVTTSSNSNSSSGAVVWNLLRGGSGGEDDDEVASLRVQIAERDQLIHQLNYQVDGEDSGDYGLAGLAASEKKMDHLRMMIAASAPKVPPRAFKS